MDKRILQGRREILVLFAAGLSLSLLIILAFNIKVGSQNLLPQIVRTMFTVLLMVFTYKGSKIAKWLLTASYLFGAVFIFQNQLMNSVSGFLFELYVLMFVFYCFFPLFLQLSSNIGEFLEYQKSKNNGT